MPPESSFPPDPIAAVTHPDPYPFYAGLVAQRPLYRDDALGLWVAASAGAVTAVLASDLCRVRPPAEPVPRRSWVAGRRDFPAPRADDRRRRPRPLQARGRGDSGLVRRDGDGRREPPLGRPPGRRVRPDDSKGLAGFHFRLPVYTVASLLGVPPDELRRRPVDERPRRGPGAREHSRADRARRRRRRSPCWSVSALSVPVMGKGSSPTGSACSSSPTTRPPA